LEKEIKSTLNRSDFIEIKVLPDQLFFLNEFHLIVSFKFNDHDMWKICIIYIKIMIVLIYLIALYNLKVKSRLIYLHFFFNIL